MRPIDPTPYYAFAGTPLSEDLGVTPGLAWVPVKSLRIDPAYQREVLRNGARNIGRIAREFDWALFGVVVVSNIGGQLFAIVDGQHRTIAAAVRGIEEVPCVIIHADPGKQAKAFAAINGNVTAMTKLAIFAAEVAAGEPEAIQLRDACASAGVTICRYPKQAKDLKPGETLAFVAIRDCFKACGEETLVLALRCLTQLGYEGTGLVKASIIKALCQVLDAEPKWRESQSAVLALTREFDFRKELRAAEIKGHEGNIGVHAALAMRLFDLFEAEFGE